MAPARLLHVSRPAPDAERQQAVKATSDLRPRHRALPATWMDWANKPPDALNPARPTASPWVQTAPTANFKHVWGRKDPERRCDSTCCNLSELAVYDVTAAEVRDESA